jgi:hypothetical protein
MKSVVIYLYPVIYKTYPTADLQTGVVFDDPARPVVDQEQLVPVQFL